jgi:hypothetical protein
LVAGQFEFWRHHSLYWRPILHQIKASGLDLVSTFVCWDFHEVARADFDFAGRTYPSRNLIGFIDQCCEEGLGVLVRIGPYIDAGWPTRGPAADVAALERLHPRYLERTREYVEALAPVLIPRLASNGGPITLIAIDCEAYFPRATSTITDFGAGSVHVPYDEELVTRLYRKWLSGRYPCDQMIASAWQDPGLTTANVTEPRYSRASLAETLDSFEFMTAAIREAYEGLRRMCTDAGLTGVPFYTNNKNMMHFIDWRNVEQTINSHSFSHSMPHLWPGDQKLVASWYFRLFRARVKFCWAGEFHGGDFEGRTHSFGILTPEHTRFTSLMAMALGVRGLCYYMFVDRDNSLFSPISPLGQVRPRMAAFRDTIRVLKELRPDEHVATVGLLWSLDHHRCFVATRLDDWRNLSAICTEYAEPKELPPWWAVFRRLHELDMDFDIAPLDQDLGRYRVLIYAGPDFARREELERLLHWVERGGTLLVVTALPDHTGAGIDLSQITASIRRANTVILRSWGGWERALDAVGAPHGVQALLPGLWTFAYRDDEGATLFVANVSTVAQPVRICLGNEFFSEVNGASARDLLSGRRWTVTSPSLWEDQPPMLGAHEVYCIRLAR